MGSSNCVPTGFCSHNFNFPLQYKPVWHFESIHQDIISEINFSSIENYKCIIKKKPVILPIENQLK